jgi:flagellar biosynthetic protein FlhB
MPESAQEKTEQPTPRRRKEARDQGQVARSQDLTAAVSLLAGMVLLATLGESFLHRLLLVMREMGTPAPLTVDDLWTPTLRTGRQVAWILVPFMLLLALATVLSMVVQFGILVSWKKLKPQPNMLSPLRGLKQIFSLNALMRFGQGLMKTIIVGVVAWLTIKEQIQPVLGTGALHAWGVLFAGSDLIYTLAIRLTIVLLILALLDFIWQKYRHEEGLKMTKQEVKDEMKKMDGDPVAKKRQREAQVKVAMQQVQQNVPQADVVVTNPTEYAVAIKYDEDTMDAPRVLAKGTDLLAMRIRQLAQQHGIPIVQRPPLARALYAQTDPGQEVPPALYKAVAEVLAYVYRLSRRAGAAT